MGFTLAESGEPAWFAAATAVLDGRYPASWDGLEEALVDGEEPGGDGDPPPQRDE
jgi:hypothetical protein